MPTGAVPKDGPIEPGTGMVPRNLPAGPGVASATEEPASKDFTEVPVYFATDRKRTDSLDPNLRFGGGRNLEDGYLTYGRANITIPRFHRMGVVERPRWWKLEFQEDSKKHVVMLEPVLMDRDGFYAEIRDSAGSAHQNELFMFIHGFNVPYADAMRRTGQMVFDLGFGGVAFCYSWPSQGDFTKYPVDKENSDWTIPHLTKVLVDLQEETAFDKVHIIAHSMGTRVLSSALAEARDQGFDLKLNNVILAAPDIDADIFKEQILPKIKGSAQRLTMYASSGDTALNLSTKFNGSRRLGLSGDGMVVIPEMMDTVDASGIDTSLIGHSYYGSQKAVVADLFKLVIQGLLPPDRSLRHGALGQWELPLEIQVPAPQP